MTTNSAHRPAFVPRARQVSQPDQVAARGPAPRRIVGRIRRQQNPHALRIPFFRQQRPHLFIRQLFQLLQGAQLLEAGAVWSRPIAGNVIPLAGSMREAAIAAQDQSIMPPETSMRWPECAASCATGKPFSA